MNQLAAKPKSQHRQSYSDLSLEVVIARFNLSVNAANLFQSAPRLSPTAWLNESLTQGRDLSVISEKARAEFIIAPILLFIKARHSGMISIHSGTKLDVSPEDGLRGICDFIIAKGPPLPVMQAPLLVMVEAKKNDVTEGLGQCAAEMIAAQIFNQRRGRPINPIYGCVTTGETWQFLSLSQQQLTIDQQSYVMQDVDAILGILDFIVSR